MQRGLSAVCAVVVAAVMLSSEVEGQLSLGAGPSFPMGALADETRPGHHVQGSAGFGLPRIPFRFRTDLFYQRFNSVEREPSVNVSLGGEWYRQLGFKLNGVYEMPLGALNPYGLVGGAWLREWHGDRTYSGTRHSAFSVNAGAGVNIPIPGGIALFVEAPYLNLFGGKALRTNAPAVNDQVQFRSVPMTIGVRF